MSEPTDPLTALRAAFPLVTWTTQEGFGRDVYEGANANLDHEITVARSLLMPRWHARCGPGTASMAEDPVVAVRAALTRLAARLRAQTEAAERVLGIAPGEVPGG